VWQPATKPDLVNLHQIASGLISAVNPFVLATVQRSTGYTTNPDGSRVPQYATFTARMQVQSLTYRDLELLDGLNISGTRRAIYLSGEVEGLVRAQQEGGDLIIFPDGTPGVPESNTWLAAYVLEHWSQWVKIAIVAQLNS